MLLELRVENLGIIAELGVHLGPGMTVITGETGAGKTLIVDALELLCGGRADPALVREGSDEAHVQGRFAWGDGDDEVVLARVVPAVGRSRGYVDGRLATANELAEWGLRLVDLHGQHAHQSLLAPVEQRALLDRYAGPDADAALQRLRAARAEVRRIEAELATFGGDERARAREVDLLRYQLDELDTAAIEDAGEDDRLTRREEILADASAHREALTSAHDLLAGPAADALGDAVAALAARAPFSAVADRLRGLQSEVAEAAYDVRAIGDDIVDDPDMLAAVQSRRAQLRELTRKYGPTLADAVAYAEEVRVRLGDLEQHHERAAALDAAREHTHREARAAADDLSAARRAAAGPLAAEVTANLQELAMPAAIFEVRVDPAGNTDTESEPTIGEDGTDEVTFLLAPNPGESLRPLHKAASGGELSRAMLALRVVLSEAPPTLVFDEVDAGIGGAAGVAVGHALATLGEAHQVLCVTHLAQVAACADAQIAVVKSEQGGRTVASAELLLDEARVAELSRMLAGVGESAHARKHARELLAKARG